MRWSYYESKDHIGNWKGKRDNVSFIISEYYDFYGKEVIGYDITLTDLKQKIFAESEDFNKKYSDFKTIEQAQNWCMHFNDDKTIHIKIKQAWERYKNGSKNVSI